MTETRSLRIAKNSVIFGFTEALHFNSKFFDSPKEFKPERFLSDIGKFDPPKEGFLPFGIGKRLCIGESLARMELLIFVVTLVQHLEFTVPEGTSLNIEPDNIPLFNLPQLNQNFVIFDRTAA
ncbi:cytochrome P450 2L1 [Armadillidium vulgare]|nr:cytochrome P450 2L1 [Armadillidium vulgare]